MLEATNYNNQIMVRRLRSYNIPTRCKRERERVREESHIYIPRERERGAPNLHSGSVYIEIYSSLAKRVM